MTIEIKVRKVIAEKLPNIDIEDVIPEASLVDDLGADSLAIVELIMTMEEVFEIDIDEDEAERMATVQDVINYINSKS